MFLTVFSFMVSDIRGKGNRSHVFTVHTAPIPARADGTTVLGRCQDDFDSTTGEVIGATITANSTQNWGTTGDDTVDPVKMLKHELGYTMRLTHSELGNLMEEAMGEGDHDRAPNRPEPEKRVEAGKTNLTLGPAGLAVATVDHDAWAAHGAPLAIYPLEGIMLPDPLAVPEGLERVLVAAGVFPLEADFTLPAELSLTWEEGAVSGLAMVGELHGALLPPVDPAGMTPCAGRPIPRSRQAARGCLLQPARRLSLQPVPASSTLPAAESTGSPRRLRERGPRSKRCMHSRTCRQCPRRWSPGP